MDKNKIKLTSAEIASLWSTYIQNTATRCFYKQFLQGLDDPEIKPIVQEALSLSEELYRKSKRFLKRRIFLFLKAFLMKIITFLHRHYIPIYLR